MKRYKPAYKSADKIPEKYFKGLNEKECLLMTKEILKRPQNLKYWSADKAYSKRLKKEKDTIPKSSYTLAYHKKYGKENTGSLEKISKVTGINANILKKVYDRGILAWQTGHKPSVRPNQWALARVYSFIMGGKTQKTTDRDLWQLHLKNKRKKNPENFDYWQYYELIITTIIVPSAHGLSKFLSYDTIGDICNDCKYDFYSCTCEGDINGGRCKECKQNYCICEYGIIDSSSEKIRKIIWQHVKKKLDDYHLKEITEKINKSLNWSPFRDNLLQTSPLLRKLNSYNGIEEASELRKIS